MKIKGRQRYSSTGERALSMCLGVREYKLLLWTYLYTLDWFKKTLFTPVLLTNYSLWALCADASNLKDALKIESHKTQEISNQFEILVLQQTWITAAKLHWYSSSFLSCWVFFPSFDFSWLQKTFCSDAAEKDICHPGDWSYDLIQNQTTTSRFLNEVVLVNRMLFFVLILTEVAQTLRKTCRPRGFVH